MSVKSPAAPRAMARHGLNALKTSPNSAEATTRPSQKVEKTNVTAKLRSGDSVP